MGYRVETHLSTTRKGAKVFDVENIAAGEQFTVRFTKRMTWRDKYRVMYNTMLGEPVEIKTRSGQVLEAVLAEIPSFFRAHPKVYLTVPGRIYRKGVPVDEIVRWSGLRAPHTQTKRSA